jgi:hypothetical protein
VVVQLTPVQRRRMESARRWRGFFMLPCDEASPGVFRVNEKLKKRGRIRDGRSLKREAFTSFSG